MEKRIISKFDIERLKSEGQTVLRLEPGDTLTPLARDTAMELGIKIQDSRELVHGAVSAAPAPTEDKLEAIVKAVLERMGPSAAAAACAPCATPKVYGARPGQLKFAKYPRDDEMPTLELRDAAGVLRNPPEIDFRLVDVITIDDSASISGGFMSWHKGPGFSWTLNYDEIDYVVEGRMEITCEGKTIYADHGDTVFIPKGSSVHWNTPTWVKIYYVTFPSNWADQI
ncbi:MAG: cupin domain-containing protein [Caldisericota bacterium]|jgi:ethanolamine utilization protein EutQ|nr:cupin domain-containing protein [Caldisericota bacterium]